MLKHLEASRIIISDYDESRLALAESLGLDAIDVKKRDLTKYAAEATRGGGADAVFECSGSEAAALEMTGLARARGTICLTGIHENPHAVNLMAVTFFEHKIFGARVYAPDEFAMAIPLAAQIGPDLEKIVSHIIPLSESEKVFQMITDPSVNTVKVLVDCRS